MDIQRTPKDRDLRLAAAAMALILRDPRAARLDGLSAQFGMDATALRRAFSDCVGISPKRFAQFACAQAGLQLLEEGKSVLDASLDAGGTSAGFLHAVTCAAEAISPGEAASGGAGLALAEGFFHTLLGLAHCARGPRGVVHLDLLDGEDPSSMAAAKARLRARFPNAKIEPAPDAFEDIRQALAPGRAPARVALMLSGTNFQIKAWQAALGIPSGSTATYGQIAAVAGSERASRAAGSAMGANSIALLVPCHRALRADGEAGAYRWSSWRKRAILALEAAGRAPEPAAALTAASASASPSRPAPTSSTRATPSWGPPKSTSRRGATP